MLLIGLPVGVMCAVKQYTAFDDITNVVSKFLGAVPSFWLGLMLMIWFSVGLGWFPTYGIKEGAKSYVLPIFTLLLPFLAQFIRQVRSAMLDCIRQDYVRTARAKGASERRVIFHEALKNAMLPIITFAGGCFASMIGGAVTVEKLFAIPGIGYKVVEAINTRDIPTMLACVMFLSILTIVVQLLIDLSYAFIDPRVRSTFVSVKKKKAPKKAEEVKAA
jgi:peptide/nickel transport system permease protein